MEEARLVAAWTVVTFHNRLPGYNRHHGTGQHLAPQTCLGGFALLLPLSWALYAPLLQFDQSSR